MIGGGASIGICWIVLLGLHTSVGAQQSTSTIVEIQSQIRAHQLDEALVGTNTALRKTPNDARLWTLKGIALSMKGNNTESIAAFDKALHLAPDTIAALKGESQLLFQSQDRRAIPLLERIVKADPNDATAHEMLGVLERKQGNCVGSINQFTLSGESMQSHPASLEADGYCLVQLNQTDKAILVFQQLVALLPDKTYPKYDLAVLLVQSRQNEPALKLLEPMTEAASPDPEILSLAAEAYEANGETPKAVALLRQAIVLSPTNAGYYTAFAGICLDHDSFQVGIDMMNAGLKYVSNDPGIYLSRGLLYAQLAEYDKAEADFRTAEQFDSKQGLSSYAIDLAELQRNNPEKAAAEIRAQLKAHPDNVLLHCLLAKMLTSQGPDSDAKAVSEAKASVEEAIRLQPSSVEARNILASIDFNAGEYDAAIGQCRLALKYAPDDQTAMYHLIMALRHAGKPEQREEIHTLVKRLSELQQASLKLETSRKQFKLVVAQPPPAK
jgi:tetratricopeptide (TPR) repeat protein